MKSARALLLAFVLLLPSARRPAAAAAHPHQFCLHNRNTLSLCLWDAPIGIGVEGTARVRDARQRLGSLWIGPVSFSPYVGSRQVGNLRDVNFPVIGTEQAYADHVAYHLEAGNPENALLLYMWSNCQPSCAAARWVWRLSMENPSESRHITLSPGP